MYFRAIDFPENQKDLSYIDYLGTCTKYSRQTRLRSSTHKLGRTIFIKNISYYIYKMSLKLNEKVSNTDIQAHTCTDGPSSQNT